uniref:Transmembrane protein n=1 Tax=viral metagenome TaxID=1070528 RepID=A0A6C0C3X9_9ZZZZ
MFNDETPMLTEPGVKYFLRETLKQCHDKRANYYNTAWNCGFFIFLVLLFGLVLSYRKRHKLTPEEKKEKRERDHSHVMSKIKTLREERKKLNNEIITNLPKFENDFEIMHKKYYAM